MRKRKNKIDFDYLLRLFVYTISLLTTFIYIFYRIFFTLPVKYRIIDLVFGIIVLFIEFIETIDFFVYYYNVLCAKRKEYIIPKVNKSLYPDVDVFIATINESVELIEDTIKHCLKMKYPSKKKVHIYVCDDGKRSEIKKLCKKYGINYITRNDNKDAKAGNYNNALSKTSSPLIATFDADMKPTPNFLMTTIPFFIEDKNVGFVQLPQSFNNPDLFQLKTGLYDDLPFEQDYFYHCIQLSKNNINTTIYCGTNAVLSRKAISNINGFATKTITEDFATGMLIESSGYKGIALHNVEAYGVAVDNLESYAKQRSRWGRGCIQVLKNYKIVNNKGLKLRQKIDYSFSIYYWFFGFKRVIYIFIPMLFVFFGINVIDCNFIIFIILFFTQYLIKRFSIDILEDNKRSSTWNKIYELTIAPFLLKEIIRELIGFGSKKFEVTSKDKTTTIKNKESKISSRIILFHIIVFIITIICNCISLYKILFLKHFEYILPIMWLSFNTMYLLFVIMLNLNKKTSKGKKFNPNKNEQYTSKLIPKAIINMIK